MTIEELLEQDRSVVRTLFANPAWEAFKQTIKEMKESGAERVMRKKPITIDGLIEEVFMKGWWQALKDIEERIRLVEERALFDEEKGN